jgi:hypothetical protein
MCAEMDYYVLFIHLSILAGPRVTGVEEILEIVKTWAGLGLAFR